jgi:3-polyprenyl-4-hydroxybenzoate decarboxylase
LLVVSVDERYPKNGIKAMLALWGTGQLVLTKVMIIVSSDVNPRDWNAVLKEIGDNFDPNEDFLMIPWAPLDTLDFTSGKFNVGSKMGINAVRKPNNGKKKQPVPKNVPDPRAKHNEIIDWKLLPGGILAIKIDKNPKETIKKLFNTKGYEDVRIIVIVSPDIDVHNTTELIWGIFTRFDPYLDVIFEHTELKGSAVVYGGRMGIDATVKSWYPKVIEMSEDIKEKVSDRWKEYWQT